MLTAKRLEQDLQREFLLCPECGEDVHTTAAEGVPAQSLRACHCCGAVFFADLDSAPRYIAERKTNESNDCPPQ